MTNNYPQQIASLRWLVAAALGLSALSAQAMEDESIYSYTRVEAGTGKIRGQAGSSQSFNVDGWIGGDFNRLWYQFDGERAGGRTEAAELQLLYGRYIAPFWDAQEWNKALLEIEDEAKERKTAPKPKAMVAYAEECSEWTDFVPSEDESMADEEAATALVMRTFGHV